MVPLMRDPRNRAKRVEGENSRTIFVGSSTDMWAQAVPQAWIEAVLEQCNRYPGNTYVFQTKNPVRFKDFFFRFPPSTMLGTTIETDFYPGAEIISKAPSHIRRASALAEIPTTYPPFTGPYNGKITKFVSIEPILDFNPIRLAYLNMIIQPAFVSIGADSKGHGLQEPLADKLLELIRRLSMFTEVRVKPNLRRLLPGLQFIT